MINLDSITNENNKKNIMKNGHIFLIIRIEF